MNKRIGWLTVGCIGLLAVWAAVGLGEPAAKPTTKPATKPATKPSDARPKPRRYIARGDIVEDTQTGLLWQMDGSVSGKKNFEEAKKYAAGLKLGKMTGWRVPTREEIATIFPANFAPFTNTHYNPKPCCKGKGEWDSYWTSELDDRRPDYAWIYQWYEEGGANNGTASANFVYVRCVHDPVTKK